MTAEEWGQLGSAISNNTYLKEIEFGNYVFGLEIDYEKMSSFFRGLTGSSTIEEINLGTNEFGVQGVHYMTPFLQNASSLTNLDIGGNDIGSEGFNFLWRALCDSPIEQLGCGNCGIETIEIDENHLPKNLTDLRLADNNINADGCRELTKLLQGRDSTLKELYLQQNKIDDEGVRILADALQSNTSLLWLFLVNNRGMTNKSSKTLLKLVLDISSIKATLGSNHTLQNINLIDADNDERSILIQKEISSALNINLTHGMMGTAGRDKVIYSQLCCGARSQLCRLQGVERSNASFYSQFDPLHLPEVLALTGEYHGQGDLYIALRWSLNVLFSTVDKEVYLKQQIDYHKGRMLMHEYIYKGLQAELASIQGQGAESENRSAKRSRIE